MSSADVVMHGRNKKEQESSNEFQSNFHCISSSNCRAVSLEGNSNTVSSCYITVEQSGPS
jgi:hypothetical protein